MISALLHCRLGAPDAGVAQFGLSKQPGIKVKQCGWIGGDISEVWVRWIEQEVVFVWHDNRRHFEHG